MNALQQRLQARLDARAQQHRLRQLPKPLAGIDFCSNDYLGLASIAWPEGQAAVGSTGSRLISGNSQAHVWLEQVLAEQQGFEAALSFGSGFAANLGLLACIAERGDTLLLDELAHASLIDGARLSHAERRRFAHNDLDGLRQKLKLPHRGQVFVVVESVYSMDGDSAPLAEISALCVEHGAALIVDEAHALGVMGEAGEGLVSALGLQDRVAACVYTFGKALGCHGALIAGSSTLQHYLLNFCRPQIYTTAPSPQHMQHMLAAYQHSRQMHAERAHLQRLIAQFKQCIGELPGLSLIDSHSPIQGLVIPGELRVKHVAEALQARGFAVKAILSPTVPAGSERLRLCLHSHNTRAQIEQLQHALLEVL